MPFETLAEEVVPTSGDDVVQTIGLDADIFGK